VGIGEGPHPRCVHGRIRACRPGGIGPYQRLHLWATANGLALQPLNQVTERIARDRSQGRTSPLEAPLAELTPSGRAALFTFRIGHPTVAAGLSPRRRLADVVEN